MKEVAADVSEAIFRPFRTHLGNLRLVQAASLINKPRAALRKQIMRESLVPVAIGMAIGMGAALGSSRLIASQLSGVTPLDVPTYAFAMLVMIAVSAAAGYWPARRASRVDPTAACC